MYYLCDTVMDGRNENTGTDRHDKKNDRKINN